MEKMKKTEASSDLMETANEDGVQVLETSTKGGFRTMPFIIGELIIRIQKWVLFANDFDFGFCL